MMLRAWGAKPISLWNRVFRSGPTRVACLCRRVRVRQGALLGLCVALFAFGLHGAEPAMPTTASEIVLEGQQILLDDALFVGCYHNAFEGAVIENTDGTLKTGRQGIQRTKGILVGAGSAFNQMTLRFQLERTVEGEVALVLKGVDDAVEPGNVIEVRLNDKSVHHGPLFPNSDLSLTTNPRYFLGWKERRLQIPAGVLQAGENVLVIENSTPLFESDHYTYTAIDYARLEFDHDVRISVTRPDWPIYYFGLNEGIEMNVWPTVNLGRICLISGADLEFNFYATFPPAVVETLGKAMPLRLNIATDGDIGVTTLEGESFERETAADGKTILFRDLNLRVVKGTTPHPAQGTRVMVRANEAFEGKTLTAWYSAPGVASQPRTFPLRAADLPGESPDTAGFELSIWGGGIPSEPRARTEYIDLAHRAGVSRMFTGNTPDLNRVLKEQGINAYPRFGWFGGKYKLSEETRQWASIRADGTTDKADYCPLAILEQADNPLLGRYFAEARTLAGLPDIDGLCVDFECAAVWCWCERCMQRFAEETGIQATREQLAPGGEYAEDYKQFGRRRNRELLARVREIMREVNPKLRYVALASAADMPAYWWDGRFRGRHTLRELTRFADEIAASGYFYEMPGGMKSVRAIIDTGHQFALASGREVDISMISPIATTVSETPRYRGAVMGPDSLRQLILLIASAQGRGLSIFRGDCFDGEHYLACRRALDELVLLRPYFEGNPDRSGEVIATPAGKIERHYALTIAQNLMSRMPWRPDIAYQYDAVHYTRDYTGRDRVVLLFNYSDAPLPLNIKILGLFDDTYRLAELVTGRELQVVSRAELERGKVELTVPPRDVLLVRVTELDLK